MELDVDGAAAPPRSNGELVFDAPWQTRVFGLAAAVVETTFDGDREPFRQRLIAAIADDPERPYWDSWALALEDLVTSTGLLPTGAVDTHLEGRTSADS
jgi:hypothetical protein